MNRSRSLIISGTLPGFDTLRLLGAASVLLSHSYLIAQNSEGSEPLQQLLGGEKNIAGLYGVFMFFIMSGFLLARSLDRNPDVVRFLINRFLRLVPGFACCVILCAVVVGPLSSSLSVANYFADPAWFNYILHALKTFGDSPLPGVFQYTGSVSQVVNGSLWSLQAEVLSYALLLGLWLLLPSPGLVALVLGATGVAMITYPPLSGWLPGICYPLPYFAAGVVMWWSTAHLGISSPLAYLCGAGLVAGALLGFPHQAFAFFGAYLVVFLGCQPSPIGGWIERTGDLSYGLYLFGWPVQQLLRQSLDLRNPLLMFALSAVLTAVLAWGLFHGVEKPAMTLRQSMSVWLKQRWPSRA
ncbi:MAG: acyltransferase [Cyanobium sp.]